MADIINIKAGILKFNEWKDYESIPEHTRGALLRYRDQGLMPGGFLTSVLTNDLFGAVARADSQNIYVLKDICNWVYMRMPSASWGSLDKMDEWAKAGGNIGLAKLVSDTIGDENE